MPRRGSNSASAEIRLPSLEQILELNRDFTTNPDRGGGTYIPETNNLLHPGSLEHILYATQYRIFGVDRYPGLIEKAGAIGHCIIRKHIFVDGNKRTGMATCLQTLYVNGYELEIPSPEIIEIGVSIEEAQLSLEEFIAWLKSKIH